MKLKVLTQSQVEHFMEYGWVKLEAAFSYNHALEAQEHVWKQLEKRGLRKDEPSTWTQPLIHLKENYVSPAFTACQTERLEDAVEDLIGEGRWEGRGKPIHWGWWPVNFSSGAERPWDVPTNGWHIDGLHYPQYLDSREQGLLLLCLFSEIGPHGGGTLVAERSHHLVANVFPRHPEGMDVKDVISTVNKHPWTSRLTGQPLGDNAEIPDVINRIDFFMNKEYTDGCGIRLKVVETTGSPGDIILGHPFLYHAASQNHSGIPRFLCNNLTAIREKLNFRRSDPQDYSPLETSIMESLRLYGEKKME